MINVALQFTNEGIASVSASELSIVVSFPTLSVGGAGGLQLYHFITNGNATQTLSALAGKTFMALTVDGTFLRKQTPNNEWAYTKSTGQIQYTNTIPAGAEGMVFYKNQ